ncbi:ATP-dependent DNA ligase [Streptomyces sp. NPDC057302]|uniref:ATP-dependent DNA ligase n=1 Tax=Streptomyces sp. NPDC057302 TaxID=3346094 RepID=UPI003634B826
MVLRPPVEPMLAQAREALPSPGALPGDLVFQPKWDGFRSVIFTPDSSPGLVLLQSRRGAFLQDRFPDLVRAAAHLPDGWVLDCELIVTDQGAMSFEGLQRRAAARGRTAARLADILPAHAVVFDVLQADGQELLTTPYAERRARIEGLFSACQLAAPWTLCPETTDTALAREWFTTWTDVPGIEGLVVRGSRQRYLPGARALIKVRRRDSAEAIIGAITGTPDHPRGLVLGRFDEAGVLRAVGRSTPLRGDASRRVAARLTPAGQGRGHPWEGVRFTASWGSRTPLDVVLVEPELVAEIEVDTAQERGAWRHPVRLARLRPDISTGDVPPFGAVARPGRPSSGAVRRHRRGTPTRPHRRPPVEGP